jgi:hypothetical protein
MPHRFAIRLLTRHADHATIAATLTLADRDISRRTRAFERLISTPPNTHVCI